MKVLHLSPTSTMNKHNYKQLLDEVFVISMQTNQGRGKGYQPKAESLTTLIETWIILDIRKVKSNNCFIID